MVEVLIKTRNFRLHGEKKQQVKVVVEIGNIEIYNQQSSEYGLSPDDVVGNIENFVSSLRSGLSASGVNSSIKRINF